MAVFGTIEAELRATEEAAEELLQQAARDGVDAHSMVRLEKLATACARLAFGNGLNLRVNIHHLIAWCDHLDDEAWKARFVDALGVYPLVPPWDAPNPTFQRTATRPLN